MFNRYRKSADHLILAMAALTSGDLDGAAEHLDKAQKEKDFTIMLDEVNAANQAKFAKPARKTSRPASALARSLRKRVEAMEELDEEVEDEELEAGDDMEDEEEELEASDDMEDEKAPEDTAAKVQARVKRAARNRQLLRRR